LETGFSAKQVVHPGWTLQELIGPKIVEFFSEEGERLGDKESLKQGIHDITGIPIKPPEAALYLRINPRISAVSLSSHYFHAP
jgi:hypothetical protein